MIQLDFLIFWQVTTVEAFPIHFCFVCPFITILIWLSCMLLQYLILEKKFEYYYYLLKLYKNTVMYQKLLVTFCGNRNFIEDLFDR